LKIYAGEFRSGRDAVRYIKLLLLALVAAAGPGLTSAQELRPVPNPEQLGFSSTRLQRLTDTYQGYVDRGELPGAVLLIARGEKIAYLQAVGYRSSGSFFRGPGFGRPLSSRLPQPYLCGDDRVGAGSPIVA
jgi:hypothetical protein